MDLVELGEGLEVEEGFFCQLWRGMLPWVLPRQANGAHQQPRELGRGPESLEYSLTDASVAGTTGDAVLGLLIHGHCGGIWYFKVLSYGT